MTVPLRTLAAGAACLLLLGRIGAQAPAGAGPVIGIGNFSHIVANLERAVQFYGDVLGLRPEAPPQVFAGELAMKVSNAAGARALFARLPIAGSPLGVEIIEYTDIDRRAVRRKYHDPGAANLILTVRDLDAVLARAKAAGADVKTAGGTAVTVSGIGHTALVQDPDGFFIELVQPVAAPETAAPAAANIVGSRFELVVADADATARVYSQALGLERVPATALRSLATITDALGTPGAKSTRAAVCVPGSTIIAFAQVEGPTGERLRTRFQDPGTAVLQFRVHNAENVTRAWRAAGGEVVTAGLSPVNLGTLTLVVLRDPNNLMLEMIAAP